MRGSAATTAFAPQATPGPGERTRPAHGKPLRVFLTAAEVSGDQHAAQLIRSLRELHPDITVEGLGGPEMAAAGATLHRDTVTKAAMGWRGALRAFEIYKILRWTRRHFDANRPDLWIGVDSPSMNFHFARAAHERGIPTFQFVAPQLWGWAEWRMKKLCRWVDEVACVLPFEEAYFQSHGVRATFIGHPLFDELPPRRERPPGPRFPEVSPVIGLLPGSRRSIAQANFPRQVEVAAGLLAAFPTARFLVPTTAATDPVVRAELARNKLPVSAVTRELQAFDALVPQCDLCITVSGTATLHVASFGVPMIVVYAGSPLLWNTLGKRFIKTRTFALVNLLADPTPLIPDPQHVRHLVPETVPWHGPVADVLRQAMDFLAHPELLDQQRERLNAMVRRLDHPGASMNAARRASALMVPREND